MKMNLIKYLGIAALGFLPSCGYKTEMETNIESAYVKTDRELFEKNKEEEDFSTKRILKSLNYYMLEDLNGDEKTDFRDIIENINYVLGKGRPVNVYEADLNNDGE